ncbi:TatD family hydrolase [Eubacteriales bacterium OttesenSCG-928-A19]|nr:TatD family hydrolase [Eubacteriales bacterium OttesenSCG-928-A19]
MMLFDTHCHLNDERFDADRDDILDDMQVRGVTPCVVVGADMPSSVDCQALAQTRPWLYFAAGVHPHDAKDYTDAAHEALLQMMHDPKCVAWGEIGLDYYYDHSPRGVQREVFVRQLEAATAQKKPVIFHVRDAHGDTTDLLRERRKSLPQGVMHCYGGSAEQAKVYLDMGFYISLAGPVTFKKAPKLHEVAKLVPDDRLLIETDSPYLAPEPVRGRRNDPRNVAYVARRVAELRGMDYEALCDMTRRNGMRLFGIKEPS